VPNLSGTRRADLDVGWRPRLFRNGLVVGYSFRECETGNAKICFGRETQTLPRFTFVSGWSGFLCMIRAGLDITNGSCLGNVDAAYVTSYICVALLIYSWSCVFVLPCAEEYAWELHTTRLLELQARKTFGYPLVIWFSEASARENHCFDREPSRLNEIPRKC
jgi:hypothetical protein